MSLSAAEAIAPAKEGLVRFGAAEPERVRGKGIVAFNFGCFIYGTRMAAFQDDSVQNHYRGWPIPSSS